MVEGTAAGSGDVGGAEGLAEARAVEVGEALVGAEGLRIVDQECVEEAGVTLHRRSRGLDMQDENSRDAERFRDYDGRRDGCRSLQSTW